MARLPSVDEKTVAGIVEEALRTEAEAPALPGELPPPQVVRKLGAVKLAEVGGGIVPLAELWAERPAGFNFLRHYG